MTVLEKILNRYLEAEKIANTDLSAWNVRTLPGMQMAQREACANMEKYLKEYKETIRQSAVTIFTSGTPADQTTFAEVASEKTKPLVFRADDLYLKLADEIRPSMGDRGVFGTTQLVQLMSKLASIAKDLEFGSVIPTPSLDITPCPDLDSLVTVIRNLTRQAAGDRLNALYIEDGVTKVAVAIRYIRNVPPVLITGATPEEQETLPELLFTHISFKVPVDEKAVLPEAVLEAFTNIKESLHQMKNNSKTSTSTTPKN